MIRQAETIDAAPIHVRDPRCLKRGMDEKPKVKARPTAVKPIVQIAWSVIVFKAMEIANMVIPEDSLWFWSDP
jgi:hypothetical protein